MLSYYYFIFSLFGLPLFPYSKKAEEEEKLVPKNITVLPHPPYSADLAACDFFLFPKLNGHHFGMMENIQKVVTDELHTLTENYFQYCYDQWKKHWNHCVTSQGSYFEGDNL